jgi:DNA-directed RNA polymerase subunit RPC12/RpoP
MTDDRMSTRPDTAEAEYEIYKRYGRPPRPYYGKCLECGETWEVDGALLDADNDARYHAGYHGGLKEEHVQVVVTDASGRELFRFHALFKPGMEPECCSGCGERVDGDQVVCPNCGHIPEADRLTTDEAVVTE